MNILNEIKKSLIVFILTTFCISGLSFASNAQANAEVSSQIFDKVKQNDNWKLAFLTAKHAQIVFMNISPSTNPNNEIGMEIHKFDQIIFVVEGNGKAILDGKTTMVKSGDMIFIPQGVAHNVTNSNAKKPLKILSVYSSTDIPANSAFKKKSDVPQD
ncbi:MAG: cupin domain-containing protein [Gammaproteobacteria bacterium]